jgi:hypothetical protein
MDQCLNLFQFGVLPRLGIRYLKEIIIEGTEQQSVLTLKFVFQVV